MPHFYRNRYNFKTIYQILTIFELNDPTPLGLHFFQYLLSENIWGKPAGAISNFFIFSKFKNAYFFIKIVIISTPFIRFEEFLNSTVRFIWGYIFPNTCFQKIFEGNPLEQFQIFSKFENAYLFVLVFWRSPVDKPLSP